jgi:hypothetical protein
LKPGAICARRFFNGWEAKNMKFKAKISFSHENKMFDPHQVEPYEFDNEELLKAWADAGYIELVEEKKAKKVKGE